MTTPSDRSWPLPKIILFLVLGFVFLTHALLAEFIGVKIFSLNDLLGWKKDGIVGDMNLTAGVLLWPVVFVMTDLINEYFGRRIVVLFSSFAALCISYSFVMIYGSLLLPPADFWRTSALSRGVPDFQVAYSAVFGQGLWIILGSVTAFLVGQLVDVWVFQRIKKATGEGRLWLRATGSTMVSQAIDSFLVLYIAFYWGGGLAVGSGHVRCLVELRIQMGRCFGHDPFDLWGASPDRGLFGSGLGSKHASRCPSFGISRRRVNLHFLPFA